MFCRWKYITTSVLLELKSVKTSGLLWLLNIFQVSAGSADRFVYIWDTTSRRIQYKLPGHNGSINDVDFHPKEPIIMSGSSDKLVYIGEIE
jgi:Prp8 binding protein